MANRIIYRLVPELRSDLIAYRYREYDLKTAIISTNEIMDDIRSRELWLNNHPLDHPNRDEVEAALSMLRNDFNEHAIEQQTIRQEVYLQRYNLAHWIYHISNFQSSFPYCFACESVQEIDAVYTLKNRTVHWPDDYVFRVALLPPPPHATFQQLRDRARHFRLDVVILPL